MQIVGIYAPYDAPLPGRDHSHACTISLSHPYAGLEPTVTPPLHQTLAPSPPSFVSARGLSWRKAEDTGSAVTGCAKTGRCWHKVHHLSKGRRHATDPETAQRRLATGCPEPDKLHDYLTSIFTPALCTAWKSAELGQTEHSTYGS